MLPEYPAGPGYWMNETSGVLVPAVERYLEGQKLSDKDIAALRAYFRQWINSPVWADSEGVGALKTSIDGLLDRNSINKWLKNALDLGIDPL